MTPPRSRGVIALLEENCTSCMLCARECPDWCIFIESHTEPVAAVSSRAGGASTAGARERTRNQLDRFAIDFSLCMYCGICVEVCPFDALFWAPDVSYAAFDVRDLVHERDRLAGWLGSVPPPPPADPGADQPGEAVAARARNTRGGPAR